MSHRIAIVIEEPSWRKVRGLPERLKQAARRTLARGRAGKASVELTILLASDARLKELNATFRGKDKATNVLSFSTLDREAYLGDVAMAHGVTSAEARGSAKRIGDHAVHLAVHGVLHLLGYDHEIARDARIMEPLETSILAELGIADPYAARSDAA